MAASSRSGGGGYACPRRTVAVPAGVTPPSGMCFCHRDKVGMLQLAPVGPLAAPARRRNLRPRADLVRAALGLDLRTVPAPQRVEGAFLVDALVGVRSKEVALALGKRGRKTISAEAVVIGEG
jgi:hypothetical protein